VVFVRTLLLHLDTSPRPSVFDRIVALDAGADEVMSYGRVTADAVRELVHGAIFTRGPKELHRTAIFIGGTDMAAGERLPWEQADIRHQGCAIECRINAEDPKRNFQPSPGKIERLIAPGGFGVRFDSHAHSGYVVPPYYDSMIGKLIVHQATRAEAIACMQRALAELRVEGIKTTVPLHQEILGHSAFVEGRIDTTFVERTF